MATAEGLSFIQTAVMAGLDGIALAQRVGRDCPDLPILLMTGYSAERQKAHNLEQLIARVILKPFTLQQICDAAEEGLVAR
jgi:DNA-binding NtrC family response regulator